MPFFAHNGARLFYTTQGDGPPILLLHGWACDSHDWSFHIPLLLSLNLRVIALDHRGHGRSSTPSSVDSYAMKTFADDAVALLSHLGTGPAILLAHSMSTIIASIMAVNHPEIAKALVLIQPLYSGTPQALEDMSKTMLADIPRSPDLVADFFRKAMYTPQTPEWLKTWHIRRVLGSDPVMLAGCAKGIMEIFGSVMGQSDKAKAFMRKRIAPRLVVCILEAAPRWEMEIGVEEGVDHICSMDEGTFSHQVKQEEFSCILEEWLRGQGFVG